MSTSTFYADASDGGPTDADSVWSNESNSVDGNTGTYATSSGTSFGEGSNNLQIDGTNASGSGTITDVQGRIHDGTSWGDYTNIDEPVAGWSWDAIAGLEFLLYSYPDGPPLFSGDSMGCLVYEDGDYEGTILASLSALSSRNISKVEIKVSYTDGTTPVIGEKYPLPAFRNIV